MSVDLAVWEGEAPASDAEAGAVFEELYERYVESGEEVEPTDRVRQFVAALLARYPDLTELDDDAVDDSPWADGPPLRNACRPFIYFGIVANEAAKDAWEH